MKDQWSLTIWGQQAIADPNWSDIRQALVNMTDNRDQVNQLSLNSPDGRGLMAGGGGDGRFFVAYFGGGDGRSSLILTDPSMEGSELTLNMPHPNKFPSRWCVPLLLVLKAFEFFRRTGDIPKDLLWEADDLEVAGGD